MLEWQLALSSLIFMLIVHKDYMPAIAIHAIRVDLARAAILL